MQGGTEAPGRRGLSPSVNRPALPPRRHHQRNRPRTPGWPGPRGRARVGTAVPPPAQEGADRPAAGVRGGGAPRLRARGRHALGPGGLLRFNAGHGPPAPAAHPAPGSGMTPSSALAELRAGDTILDCTLGLGQDALVAALVVGPSGRVVALEKSLALYAVVSEGLNAYDYGPQLLPCARRSTPTRTRTCARCPRARSTSCSSIRCSRSPRSPSPASRCSAASPSTRRSPPSRWRRRDAWRGGGWW